ncbi:MAG TPA: riboflavin synthase [Candidatus Eisenbacteria bacterium]|nr:riboflavin synthase [Candidatus Eisenbacteria bacterium]
MARDDLMFTGLVEAKGRVRAARANRLEIDVAPKFRRLPKGSSVAVNGACLTVTSARGGALSFHLVSETLRRTTLGKLKAGDAVNLERPLREGGRFEGHFVLGHVDGVGRVLESRTRGAEKSVLVSPPARFRSLLVEKGSVAMDGVSLTLGEVTRRGFWVHLVPHTMRKTVCGAYLPGSKVNLEFDYLVKLALKKHRGKTLIDKLSRPR